MSMAVIKILIHNCIVPPNTTAPLIAPKYVVKGSCWETRGVELSYENKNSPGS